MQKQNRYIPGPKQPTDATEFTQHQLYEEEKKYKKLQSYWNTKPDFRSIF